MNYVTIESKPLSTTSPGDAAGKKRKAAEVPMIKAPPAKKALSQPTVIPSSASTTMMTVVKKEPGVKTEPGIATSSATTTKAAKTDSSFFSAPKKKPLPTFKKVPKKEESTTGPGVAQPSNFDSFQEAWKALAAKGVPVIKAEPTLQASGTSGTGTETVDSPMNVDTPPSVNLNNMAGGISLLGRRKKSVTFATDDKLESIRWITRAEYGDASEVCCALSFGERLLKTNHEFSLLRFLVTSFVHVLAYTFLERRQSIGPR